MSDFTTRLCEGDLAKFSKINIGSYERPVWVYVSHDRVDVSSWIAREVAK